MSNTSSPSVSTLASSVSSSTVLSSLSVVSISSSASAVPSSAVVSSTSSAVALSAVASSTTSNTSSSIQKSSTSSSSSSTSRKRSMSTRSVSLKCHEVLSEKKSKRAKSEPKKISGETEQVTKKPTQMTSPFANRKMALPITVPKYSLEESEVESDNPDTVLSLNLFLYPGPTSRSDILPCGLSKELRALITSECSKIYHACSKSHVCDKRKWNFIKCFVYDVYLRHHRHVISELMKCNSWRMRTECDFFAMCLGHISDLIENVTKIPLDAEQSVISQRMFTLYSQSVNLYV
jgi:hypothetical protein